MATGTLSPDPWLTVENASGVPYVGAKIYTYLAGTTTPVATYTDVGLTVANANPIVTDSAGRYVAFLTPGASYKYVIQDANGASIRTQDNIPAVPAASGNVDITGTAGEALTAGQAVYLSDGSGSKTVGQWYKADAANTYSSTGAITVGIVPASISSGAAGTVREDGQATGLTSLTIGTTYYIGTAGALTSTPPSNARLLGIADSTSSLIMAATPSFIANNPAVTANKVLAGPSSGAAAALTLRTLAGADLTSAAAVRVLDRKVTSTTVVSSVTETVVYTFSVPANTLSTNKALRCTLLGDYFNNSGGNANLAIKGKFGGTTFYTAAVAAFTSSATHRGQYLVMYLQALNATNAQAVYTNWISIGSGGVSGAATSAEFTFYGFYEAMAEDSTGALTFQITVQHDTNAATVSFKELSVLLEVVE